MNKKVLKINNELQVVWDNFIIDTAKSTASEIVHRPEPIETAFVFDAPWEVRGSSYHHIVLCHDGIYRLYYIAYPQVDTTTEISYVCAIESKDGVHWYRPEYNLYEFEGSKKNNIVFRDQREGALLTDNFMVFLDPNPKCKKEERYKAVGLAACINYDWSVCDLWCYVSEDGLNWKYSHTLMSKPDEMSWCFDSDNHVVWDGKQYVLFFRGRHRYKDYVQKEDSVADNQLRAIEQDIYNYRDIRVAYSKDFRNWEIYGELEYVDGEDYQIYANQIMRYPRNEKLWIGFPTRNVERRSMKGSFEHLGGSSGVINRQRNYSVAIRSATVMTDCLFMTSRDTKKWERSKDAFYTAGPETAGNWCYGDGYIVPFFLETPGRFNRIDNEYTCYFCENSRAIKPKELFRYALRIDGFKSLHANYYGAKVVTKPLIFNGSKMILNFETSVLGNIYVIITDKDGNSIRSLEVFGNSVNREVVFEQDISGFSGKEVVITFEMQEADIYSFLFTV